MKYGNGSIFSCVGSGGGGGLADPGANGLVYRNALNTTVAIPSGAVGTVLIGTGSSSVPVYQAKPVYDVRDYGITQNGSTDDTSAFGTLLGTIGSNPATVLVTGHMVLSTIVIPSNITLRFEQDGAIALNPVSTSPGGGSVVQVSTPTTNGTTYTNSCSTTFPSPVGAGHTIVYFLEHNFTGVDDILPTDSMSNFYHIGTRQGFNFVSLLSNWYSANVRAGTTTVTETLAATVENQCLAIEVAGLGPTVNVTTTGQVGTEFAGFPSTTMSTAGSNNSQPAITFPVGTFVAANGGQSMVDQRPCTPQATYTMAGTTGGQTHAPIRGGTNESMCVEYLANSPGGSSNVTIATTNDPLLVTSPVAGWFMNAVGLIPGSAVVNILGPIISANKQIFYNATGGATIDLTGNTSITTVYPEWWGASPAATAATNTPALQAAIIGAYGNGRTNATGQSIYNREFRLSGKYNINNTLLMNYTNGFTWNCTQRLGCGLNQQAANASILRTTCGGSYGEFQRVQWSVSNTQDLNNPLVDLNYTCAPSTDLVTQFIDFFENGFVGNGQAAVGVRIAGAGGTAQGSNLNFNDNAWSGFTEAALLIGNTAGGYIPNNSNGNVGMNCSAFATNALALTLYNGDIQASPMWGVENCGGGFVIVDGVSFENGFGNQQGCDMGFRSGSAGNRFVVRGVRSESACMISSSSNLDISDSTALFQANVPVPGSASAAAGAYSSIITPSDSNPLGGGYYRVTTAGTFGGLGSVSSPRSASGGTANTLVDSAGGLTVNAWTNWILSILSGTGQYSYCKIASNTVTTFTCTTSTFQTVYVGPTGSPFVQTPDATSRYIVEPDYATMTTNGGVTFGPIPQITFLSKVTARNTHFPGTQISFAWAGSSLETVDVTRADWQAFYQAGHNGPLDDTSIPPTLMGFIVGRPTTGGGISQPPYKMWNVQTNGSVRPNRAFLDEKGTGVIHWASAQFGAGPKVLDAGIEPAGGTVATPGFNNTPYTGCMELFNDSTITPTFYAWQWCYDGSWSWPGAQLWKTDNANDIGAVGANRPRTLYVGTSINVAGNVVPVTIASGSTALNTVAIASATCDTVVTASATGVATTDAIQANFNGDPTGITGYIPSVSGMLTIFIYPTTNNVNFKVCNNTSNPITPGAVTLNWKVVR